MRSYDMKGYYRGCLDVVGRLVGNDKSTFFVDGVNGDGSDEWDVEKSIDEVIKLFEKVGFEIDEEEGTITEPIVDVEVWDSLWEALFG